VQAAPNFAAFTTNMPGAVPGRLLTRRITGAPMPDGLSPERNSRSSADIRLQQGIAYGYSGAAPQTLYGIADSPVAWPPISWTRRVSYALISRVFPEEAAGLTRDDVLDNITITWLTNTAIFRSTASTGKANSRISDVKGVPSGCRKCFPDEIDLCPAVGRSGRIPNDPLQQARKGGHFAAWDSRTLSEEVALGFRSLR